MRWLGRVLAGPTLWALIFSLVYGLHGVFCAGLVGPEALGSTARVGLVGVWLLGVVAFIPLVRQMPTGQGLEHWLPRAGAWTGLGATVFTLFPVFLTTSC